jgi:hypothetical protein
VCFFEVLHATLVSLCAVAVRPIVLQASLAVFCSLSFAHPDLSVYRTFASLLSASLQLSHVRSTALMCLRALLESSFRNRDSPLFAHACLVVGAVGPDVIETCCATQAHEDEELKVLVFMHAIAGALGNYKKKNFVFFNKTFVFFRSRYSSRSAACFCFAADERASARHRSRGAPFFGPVAVCQLQSRRIAIEC